MGATGSTSITVGGVVAGVWDEPIANPRVAASIGKRVDDAVGLDTLTAAKVAFIDAAITSRADGANYTAARAGYLDNINNAQLLNISAAILARIDAAISTRSTFATADLTTVLDARDLTATRMSAIFRYADGTVGAVTTTGATFTYADNATEQDVLELNALTSHSWVSLDINALTQGATIRVYNKVDGTNYRLVDTLDTLTDLPANAKDIDIILYGKGTAQKITIQRQVAEGAARSIPYRYRIVP